MDGRGALGALWALQFHSSQVVVDVGGQQSPQLIYFGTDARVKDPSRFAVPIEALAGFFFLLIALMFAGPGQELGRRFDGVGDRVVAYTVGHPRQPGRDHDVRAALLRPASAGRRLVRRRPDDRLDVHPTMAGGTARRRPGGALAVVWLADWPRDARGVETQVAWSMPGHQVKYKPRYRSIDVNNLGHQGCCRSAEGGPAYHAAVPDEPRRRAAIVQGRDGQSAPAPGNDVAAALSAGAGHVDAVEIDPVINGLLTPLPSRPALPPTRSVTVHLDDGRSFVRRTDRSYDLISYALVDSLVLHSGYSSIRLESFLYTEQAFRDLKEHLKPGGMLVVYNYYRQGWVVGRLAKLAGDVFRAPATGLLPALSAANQSRRRPARPPSHS